MTLRVAINGFGRIGRNIVRAHYQSMKHEDIEFVAINDLGDTTTNAHLLKYDSAYGPMLHDIQAGADHIKVGTEKIIILNENESTYIPKESKHRLTNNTNKPLVIIEIQTGSYLGEDDIERFEDNYGRLNFK